VNHNFLLSDQKNLRIIMFLMKIHLESRRAPIDLHLASGNEPEAGRTDPTFRVQTPWLSEISRENVRPLKSLARRLSYSVNRVNQPEGFRRRQDRLLHLVHHIGKPNPAFRIRERNAPSGSRMPKRSVVRSE
jgi:hypothetical protein